MNGEVYKDYYQVLGISRNATAEDIKKARRELSKKYHPDLQTDEQLKKEYGEKLAEINNAADILSNPKKRAEYDREYNEYIKSQQAKKQSSKSQSRDESYRKYWGQYEQDVYQSSRTQQTKTTEQRSYTNFKKQAKSSIKTSIFDDIKKAYYEVKREEKDGLKKARIIHENVDKYVDEKYKDRETPLDEVMYKTSKGTLHVFVSTIQELSKLRYITKDSIPKFVIRTRRGLAVLLTFLILASGMSSLENDEEFVLPDDANTTSTTEEIGEDDTNISNLPFETIEQQDQIKIKKYHTIKAGETLSEIADMYGVKMSKIQHENNIKSPNLIRFDQVLTITYTYNKNDFNYFTNAITVDSGTSVKDIADSYETDISAIIALNEDAIVLHEGSYYIISSTINVPNFKTAEQILQSKTHGKTYQKKP